ncbi:phosphatases II [Basidiobolus meristosporus CBS 931.73]|uniref:Phosphatases II n=1 Tax=Basidiobolus meristosporus CBS 931.73 TaxID=1314790 RepID=A0A1Y1YJA1_9FUNG|nr:phosphatases II [Basidiobolus meristosporus CBS 931.73]|eukprot:ORX97933.1 phosphatases II [Basidiobolus meristosporus CBS 931.73]
MYTTTPRGLEDLVAQYPPNPTPYSNWVIPEKVICGAYPMVRDKEKCVDYLRSLLSAGVTTFVCLQEESELSMLPEYKNSLQCIHRELADHESSSLQFIHFPIRDGSILHDVLLGSLVNVLEQRVFKNNEVLYIHCWGGHGRTGTLVACLLSKYYGLNADLALELTQRLHDTRHDGVIAKSPETRVQVNQVRRIIGKYSVKSPYTASTALTPVMTPTNSVSAIPG